MHARYLPTSLSWPPPFQHEGEARRFRPLDCRSWQIPSQVESNAPLLCGATGSPQHSLGRPPRPHMRWVPWPYLREWYRPWCQTISVSVYRLWQDLWCQVLSCMGKCLHPKEEGGLGVKKLETQSCCLLMKLIHRLHHPGQSSWALWAREKISLTNLPGEVWGDHVLDLALCFTVGIPNDLHLTDRRWSIHVLLGRYLAWGKPLPLTYLALYRHYRNKNVSVRDIIRNGVRSTRTATAAIQFCNYGTGFSWITRSGHQVGLIPD